MKTLLNRRSLPVQIVAGIIGVVILSAAAALAPAIWLIREQLVQQAWAQVQQGQQASQALYAFRQTEMVGLASLIAQRPTLHQLIDGSDVEALASYLQPLLTSAGLDFIAVCSPDWARLIAASGDGLAGICEKHSNVGYTLERSVDPPLVWLVADAEVRPTETVLGQVIVGTRLDQEFVALMRAHTGLEHTLLVNGQPVATSFEAGLTGREAVVQQPATSQGRVDKMCATNEQGCQTFYVARIPVSPAGLEAEVALDVSKIEAVERRLAWIQGGSMLGVVLLCSFLGILLARRISRPLVDLVDTAARFSKGELISPVNVDTGLSEVAPVALALEQARIDLLHTLTDLQNEKDWVNQLLEAIVEGIVTLDQQQCITYFSHGAERITGWSREEVLGRPCDQVFRLDSGEGFSHSLPNPGQKVKVLVEVAGKRQATLAITRAQFAPSEAGEAEVALVFRDVSEEEAVHHLLGIFLANVAHEFRTPLSALAASIELLLDRTAELSPAELEVLLKSLHLGTLGLQTLVDNLLESASIEAGHFRVFPRPYDLTEIVNEAAQTMQPLLEKYGQQLKVQLPEQLPLVQVDPRRTVQVLVNLISNASKYGPADAEISMRVTSADGWVLVEVADQGPGIAHHQRGNIFGRFVYPGAAGSLKVGAGLGLSVVKAVVEAQGGRVEVDDRPGGGSAFWFSVKVAGDA
jgi:two-component system phosphate regulon sensor histidine kinase PhoR